MWSCATATKQIAIGCKNDKKDKGKRSVDMLVELWEFSLSFAGSCVFGRSFEERKKQRKPPPLVSNNDTITISTTVGPQEMDRDRPVGRKNKSGKLRLPLFVCASLSLSVCVLVCLERAHVGNRQNETREEKKTTTIECKATDGTIFSTNGTRTATRRTTTTKTRKTDDTHTRRWNDTVSPTGEADRQASNHKWVGPWTVEARVHGRL